MGGRHDGHELVSRRIIFSATSRAPLVSLATGLPRVAFTRRCAPAATRWWYSRLPVGCSWTGLHPASSSLTATTACPPCDHPSRRRLVLASASHRLVRKARGAVPHDRANAIHDDSMFFLEAVSDAVNTREWSVPGFVVSLPSCFVPHAGGVRDCSRLEERGLQHHSWRGWLSHGSRDSGVRTMLLRGRSYPPGEGFVPAMLSR